MACLEQSTNCAEVVTQRKSVRSSMFLPYWWLGRFITIIVVISIVLIVRQEDPDKIQDARGLLKSIGLLTPIYGQLE